MKNRDGFLDVPGTGFSLPSQFAFVKKKKEKNQPGFVNKVYFQKLNLPSVIT